MASHTARRLASSAASSVYWLPACGEIPPPGRELLAEERPVAVEALEARDGQQLELVALEPFGLLCTDAARSSRRGPSFSVGITTLAALDHFAGKALVARRRAMAMSAGATVSGPGLGAAGDGRILGRGGA